jgi:hypothetical protein
MLTTRLCLGAQTLTQKPTWPNRHRRTAFETDNSRSVLAAGLLFMPHTCPSQYPSDRLSSGDRSPAICIADTRLTGSICRLLKTDGWCPLEGDARLQLTQI